MSALQEVAYSMALFGLFLIVIPVGVFTADLVKNYFKRRKNHERKSEVHYSL